MKLSRLVPIAAAVFLAPLLAQSQTKPASSSTTAVCPVEILHVNPSWFSAKVRNASGKEIVGLVFYVALADATEHWKWYHWDFDLNRPLREFSWNKSIKAGDTRNLSWDRANFDFEHGGGGVFVLTSVLFEDGSSWEAPMDSAACKCVWYNNHKKFFLKPIVLPRRD